MKTLYPIKLKVSGIMVDLIAKITHLSYIGWRIEKIIFRGVALGLDIDYKPSLLETIYAEEQIRAQMEDLKLADKLEQEIAQ